MLAYPALANRNRSAKLTSVSSKTILQTRLIAATTLQQKGGFPLTFFNQNAIKFIFPIPESPVFAFKAAGSVTVRILDDLTALITRRRLDLR